MYSDSSDVFAPRWGKTIVSLQMEGAAPHQPLGSFPTNICGKSTTDFLDLAGRWLCELALPFERRDQALDQQGRKFLIMVQWKMANYLKGNRYLLEIHPFLTEPWLWEEVVKQLGALFWKFPGPVGVTAAAVVVCWGYVEANEANCLFDQHRHNEGDILKWI